MNNKCTAPVKGHVSGSVEEHKCPVHGRIKTVTATIDKNKISYDDNRLFAFRRKVSES